MLAQDCNRTKCHSAPECMATRPRCMATRPRLEYRLFTLSDACLFHLYRASCGVSCYQAYEICQDCRNGAPGFTGSSPRNARLETVTFRKQLIAWVFGKNQMDAALRLGRPRWPDWRLGGGRKRGASVADGSARGAVLLGPAGRPQLELEGSPPVGDPSQPPHADP